MATIDYAMCHNLRSFKMNNNNRQWISIFQKKSPKFFHNVRVLNFDEWMKNDINMTLWL